MTVAAEKQVELLAAAGVPPAALATMHVRFLAEAAASALPPVWVAHNRAARGCLTRGDAAPDAPLGDSSVQRLAWDARAAGKRALLLVAGSYT